MVRVVINYSIVQVVVWSVIALIAYFIQRSVSKAEACVCKIADQIQILSVSQKNSQVQINKVEVKKTSEEDVIKRMNGKLDKIMESINNMEMERR